MAASPVVVFQALGRNQEPATAVLDDLKRQEGFQRALFGVKMEDPETGVLCTGEMTFSFASLHSPVHNADRQPR